VVDDYQHRGAATLLLRELIAFARQSGIRKFLALVLPDNLAMLEVFRRSKEPTTVSLVDGLRRVVLSLDVTEKRRRCALRRDAMSGARAGRAWKRRLPAGRGSLTPVNEFAAASAVLQPAIAARSEA
jgi:ribosomal protein S18 acetylase RimI-like enzyme